MRRLGVIAGGLLVVNVILMAIGGQFHRARARSGKKLVAIVFDVGGIGDKSFNDSAYRGLLRAGVELDVDIEYREPKNGADRDAYLKKFADDGADLVIGVGFIFTDDITALARSRPDTFFACIDYSPKPPATPGGPPRAADDKPFPPNLAALTFREQEGSYLVGALAGLVAARESKIVGFVGGMTIPLIEKFEAGYTAGVYKTCPKCRVLSSYAGSSPSAFADPTMGRELAMSHYGAGADVIFHASGKTGEGVFRAAIEQDRLAIGVDSDQHEAAPGHVLTSMVKAVDRAVFEIARDVRDGHFAAGERVFQLWDNGVGYIYDGNNAALISADDRARVEVLRLMLIDKSIVAPYRMSDVKQP